MTFNFEYNGSRYSGWTAEDATAAGVPAPVVMQAKADALSDELTAQATAARTRVMPSPTIDLLAMVMHASAAADRASLSVEALAYADRIAAAEGVTRTALFDGWEAEHAAVCTAALAIRAALSEGLALIASVDLNAGTANADLTAAYDVSRAAIQAAETEAEVLTGA